jgi:hypothetical protein
MPIEWGASRNRMFESIAADAPRGHYPKYFLGTQSYWTLIGVPGDEHEALLDEQGMLEVDRRAFSIDPFLYSDGALLTWNDGRLVQSLERGFLPIPSVRREHLPLTLTITAWPDGTRGASTAWARYRVENHSAVARQATLYLAVRPFQANPTWQFLNNPGGASSIHRIAMRDGRLTVDSTRQIVTVTRPTAFGATRFDAGDIVDWLRRGTLPGAQEVYDSIGYASGALSYALNVPAGGSTDVIITIPFLPVPRTTAGVEASAAAALASASHDSTAQGWAAHVDHFDLDIPDERILRSVRSNLAYILINQDGAAIQPGSRSYERSWIRDGSLTSAALLRTGLSGMRRTSMRTAKCPAA